MSIGPDFPRHACDFVAVLRHHAARRGEQLAFTFLEDGERAGEGLDFAALDQRARAIAARLQHHSAPGDRVLLLYPQSLDFVCAFFGCLYAARVAVPAYPPRAHKKASRVLAIAHDATPAVALTTSAMAPQIRAEGLAVDGAPLPVLVTDCMKAEERAALAATWQPPTVDGDSLAFLQYTSGSTGTPKGVMVTHRNLLCEAADLAAGVDDWQQPVMVTWAPTFHDLGLVFGMLLPVYGGFPCYMMSPLAFLQRPPRWLEAISRYRGTLSGSPNFGFELCLRKTPPAVRRRLDLSSWRLALNGAEPVHARTLERFTADFAACGLRPETFCPAYGLAESTLKITASPTGERARTLTVDRDALERQGIVRPPAPKAKAHTLVGVGVSHGDSRLAIVDPESGVRRPPRQVGEIWAAGSVMARGYWQRSTETERTFEARTADGDGPYLRTGDLGFIADGELFITGRLKDLIILRGRNYYPQDLETTAEASHPALRPGCSAAFGLPVEDEEQAVLVLEVTPQHLQALRPDEVFAAVRQAIAEEHEIDLHAVVLLQPRTIPKTSSGKIQRSACRRAFLSGTLEEIARHRRPATGAVPMAALDRGAIAAAPPAARPALLEGYLRALAAELLGAPATLGRETPWSRLGIDSLRAVTLVHRLETDLGLIWPMTRFLEGPTLAALTAEGLSMLAAPRPPETGTDGAGPVLAANQRSLWFLQRLAPSNAAYNVTFAVTLRAPVEEAALRLAFQDLVARHGALRTTFEERGGEPVRRVKAHTELDFEAVDATTWAPAQLDAALDRAAHRPFDLAQGPLLRVHVYDRSAGESVLLVAVHHIAIDFWSLAVLLDELSLCYQARCAGGAVPLPAVGPSYDRFIAWQQELLASPRGEELLAYWRQRLAAAPAALALSTDRPRPAVQSFAGASHFFTVNPATTHGLLALAEKAETTLFTVLMAAFQLLLSRHANQEDVLVGSPASGRGRAAFRDLVGYVVNPVVLRAELVGDPSFDRFLRRTRRAVLAALAHQDFPLAQLVERLRPARAAGCHPFFQVMLVLESAPRLAALGPFALREGGYHLELRGLDLASRSLPRRAAQFDLTLTLAEVGGGLGASLEYDTDLFDRTTAARLATHFRHLLAELVAAPGLPLSHYHLLSPSEQSCLRHEWNDTRTAVDATTPVHILVAQQTVRSPEAVAIVCGDVHLSYAGLEQEAQRIADHLSGLGVGPETRVALCGERSPALMAGLLGILEAGGAYVPLDPAQPAARLTSMLQDAGVVALLMASAGPPAADTHVPPPVATPSTGSALVEHCTRRGLAVVELDRTPWPAALSRGREADSVAPENLAYVIYTSGSTGRPKGVAIPHRSLTHYLLHASTTYGLGAESSSLVHTAISFDLTVTSLFVPLLTGGRVTLLPAAPGGEALLTALERGGAPAFLKLTPSHLRALSTVPNLAPAARRVGMLIIGGEALRDEDVARWRGAAPAIRLVNEYGPTETTVGCTAWFPDAVPSRGAMPIGRPLGGQRTHVLDHRLARLPIGAVGELFVGGAGVGRGYLGRPQQTAAAFLPDPFSDRLGARLYRTGDRACWRPDGVLAFLGRIDDQVKVRGFRVEPGEVAAVLGQHPSLRQAAVVAHEGAPGEHSLVAYVVADGTSIDAAELRRHLRSTLPEPMVPAAFVVLDALPLLASGKLDRRALPPPPLARGISGAPPRTPLEELLAGLWCELLSLHRVGRHDHFFDLGGHSLLATRLLSHVRDSCGVELAVRSVFEAPTLAALAARIQAARAGETSPLPPVTTLADDEAAPLSSSQRRLWFLDQLEEGGATYNIPFALHLEGPLRPAALGRCLAEIRHRHAVLRSTFRVIDGSPLAVYEAGCAIALPVVDLQGVGERQLEHLLRCETARPFDLATGPLLRGLLLRLAADQHVLLLVLHHIVGDGWSVEILRREISTLYAAFTAGRPSPLATPVLQYGDFAAWQQRWLGDAALAGELAFWKQQLAGLPAHLALPADRPRPAVQRFRGRMLRAPLAGDLVAALEGLSRRAGATFFMTSLAAFATLLARYSGQPKLALGVPVAGRRRREIEPLVGCFVNTLVLRADLAGVPTFCRLLDQVRETALAAWDHQDLPFERLVEVLAPDRDLSRAPLFQVMFSLEEASEPLQCGVLTMKPWPLESTVARFDLTLFLEREAGGGGATACFEYSTDLFDRTTIRRLAGHFRTLLAAVAGGEERQLPGLPLLGAGEQHALLCEWNDTATALAPITLQRLLAAQAARSPDAIALVWGETRLTYGALHNAANRLAHHLRGLGVGPETRVGICLERSPALAVALLGILQAGGAYVPLDPTYPEERLAFILADAEVAVLLTRSDLAASLARHLRADSRVVRLDADQERIAEQPATSPIEKTAAGNLAYLIYTSGSTGKPKAVAIEQRSAGALIAWGTQHFSPAERAGILASTSICFDLSIFEIFLPLATGGTVVLVDSVLDLPDLPARHTVTLLNTVPSALAALLQVDGLPASVRTINLAGEALSRELVDRLHAMPGRRRVLNLYGPSEDTTYSTGAQLATDSSGPPPIGRPLAGTTAHLLDRELAPVPLGVRGELCLGGSGLARGYLGRAAQTAERFVPDPWGVVPGGRLYRTGDLATRRPDGCLVFGGRLDQQVKVRGYRIEPGEIEAQLSRHPEVRETVVVAREDSLGDPRLVAFYVPEEGAPAADSARLRAFLADKLPRPMVPAALVPLAALPRIPNGKIDRTMLTRCPLPAADDAHRTAGRPPRTPVEGVLAGIWCEVLGRGEVTIDDHFFRLGGHSLLATQVLSRVRRSLGVALPVRAAFEAPVLADLAGRIAAVRRRGAGPVLPPITARHEAAAPLSFAQRRLWFLDRLEGSGAAYHLAGAFTLRGRLDREALHRSLQVVAARHEILRTRFAMRDGEPWQLVVPPRPLPLPVIDLHHLPAARQAAVVQRLARAEAMRPFDLAAGKVLRLRLLALAPQHHVLVVALHHIAGDAWSLGLLFAEWSELDRAGRRGTSPALAQLPIQYADFARWQRRWLAAEALSEQWRYWQRQLADAPQVLELPADRPRPAVQGFRGHSLPFRLSPPRVRALRKLGQAAEATPFMVLLAAFATLLGRRGGLRDLLVGTPIAGRAAGDTERLIGCFINTLVLRVDLGGAPSFRDLLARVRGMALDAYSHQDLPFEQLVERLAPQRDLSRPPLFQVMLAFENVPFGPPTLADLEVEAVPIDLPVAHFDLTLALAQEPSGISGKWEYNTDLFDATTIRRLAGHFQALLDAVMKDIDRPLAVLPLLSAAERHQLHVAWTDTAMPLPAVGVIHQLFARWARQTPEAVAVEMASEEEGGTTRHLSYACLAASASRLAQRLRGLGVHRETPVGVQLRTGPEQLIAVLGVLAAGGVYVPLDVALPEERLARIASLTAFPALITEAVSPSRSLLALSGVRRLHPVAGETEQTVPALQVAVAPTNLAYLIFTSGSTGEPKGVAIAHRGFCNLIHDGICSLDLAPGVRFLQFYTPGFDAWLWEVFLALGSGSTLCMAPPVRRLPGRPLAALLGERRITHASFTPSALIQVPAGTYPHLRAVLAGGEACPAELVTRWARGRCFINAYGPTEITVDATVEVCSGGARPPAIGRPIANMRLYVLDDQGRPQPIGVPGELYIGGVGLARGYWRRPGWTAAAFLPDPFAGRRGQRLYRSGDRVRWLVDGRLDFLGRGDRQVKIRGFRIELGEVEAQLRARPEVREAAVVIRDGAGGPQLVAFAVAAGAGLDLGLLRDGLRRILPGYMLPASIVVRASLPVTATGKLDRVALAAMPLPAQDGVAPRSTVEDGNEAERRIAAIWCDLLQLTAVDREVSFFEVGGHSLLLPRVQERLEAAFDCKVPLLDLFRHPTVATLAAHLAGQAPEGERGVSIVHPPRVVPAAGSMDIAVIGMAGRFPGAASLEAFWHNLRGGVESISFFSARELAAAGVEQRWLDDPAYVRAHGALADVELFDADFFGVGPREAQGMDPQHRFFLACAWEALESAGHVPETFEGRIGVFAGAAHNTYRSLVESNPALAEAIGQLRLALGNDRDFLATHTSYRLGLTGPSVGVQTACSTSLVAVHLACQSLLSGECEMALAGGVSIRLPLTAGYLYEEGMINSPDGHCRAFDARAAGTVGGDGVGVVLLRPLADALAAGDAVRAVLKGSAINNDGALKVGFTAPAISGQARVIADARRRAGVRPETIGYVEAHGTGTALGDPIEVAALTEAFGAHTAQRAFCALGSVKTNVGHLNAAAGVAGLIKTVLTLEHGELPPSLHFEQPHPEIDFATSPFFVNDRLRPWPRGKAPRRAGVSSFGIGGTNAHVVLEEAPSLPAGSTAQPVQLLPLAAASEAALETASERLASHLEQHPELALADVAYTLAVGRRACAARRVVVARDPASAVEALRRPTQPAAGTGRQGTPAVVFLFPGQGAQHPGMARQLYRSEPTFRRQVDRCSHLLEPALGWPLAARLFAAPEIEDVEHELRATAVAQPVLFTVSYALARLWMSWGIRPRAMLGHSLGEYVAACLAGVFSLEDALRLVVARGRLMQRLPPGAMLSVPLATVQLQPHLGDELAVAAINGPAQTVLSGPLPAVEALRRQLAADGVEARRLETSHAFHSAMMEPMLEPFSQVLAGVALQPAQLPYLSNLTGTWIDPAAPTAGDYWLQHLRRPVRFGEGLERLLAKPEWFLLEVGPGRTLSSLMRRHPACSSTHVVVSSLPHRRNATADLEHCLATAGRLWVEGAALEWPAFYASQTRRRLSLPTYPFTPSRHWADAPRIAPSIPSAAVEAPSPAQPPQRRDPASWFFTPSWKRSPLPRSTKVTAWPGQRPLLFVDRHGLGAALASRLAAMGQQPVAVLPGDRFQRRGTETFVIDPSRPEDYSALLEAVGSGSRDLIHLWSLNGEVVADDGQISPRDCAAAQERGFYSLLFLAQALGHEPSDARFRLLVVTEGMHDVTGGEASRPEVATVLGSVAVIPQEYANVRCRALDLEPAVVADQQAGAARLLAELAAWPEAPVAALRGPHRWVRAWEPLRLPALAEGEPPLRPQGVYLITGGLGGIGLTLARYLARTVHARLILVGRTAVPSAAEAAGNGAAGKRQAIAELEALGGTVLTLAADVADQRAVEAAVERGRQRFGRIDGLIHAAGIAAGGVIQSKTRQQAAAVLAPKVEGTLHLARALAGEPLDFIVLCSSRAAASGGFGQVDYCAANAFLDAYAHSRRGGPPILSLGWDGWQQVGMSARAAASETAALHPSRREMLDRFLTPEEGVEVWRRALASGLPHLLVSTAGPEVEVPPAFPELPTLPARQALQPRPALAVSYVAPRNELEQRISETWSDLLGFEQLGVHDDFFQLGGDSLLATQMLSRLRESFAVELPVGRVFAKPTVADLAESIETARLQARYRQQRVSASIAPGEEEGEL